jgi:hypothetical protein
MSAAVLEALQGLHALRLAAVDGGGLDAVMLQLLAKMVLPICQNLIYTF